MASRFAINPITPIEDSPLEKCAIPESLDDISLQFDELEHFCDREIAHVEADRLLLLTLEIIKNDDDAAVKCVDVKTITDIQEKFNRIRKEYL